MSKPERQNTLRDEIPRSNRKESFLAWMTALLTTLIFYAQALASGSVDAGFVYTGDLWNVLLPHLAKMTSLVSRGVFAGIDLSTHGGASEIFLRTNLPSYHPLVLLQALLYTTDAAEVLIRTSVLLLVIHSLIGCYFTLRLAHRFLTLRIGAALFIAVGYTFSVQMVNALGYPPYLYCATMIPWAVYGGLRVLEARSVRLSLIHSIPVFTMLTGGYVPIGMSCAVMAWGFLAALVLYVDGTSMPYRLRVRNLCLSSVPFAIASTVAAPLFFSLLTYFNIVRESAPPTDLFFAAHQLGEQPRTILRALSTHFQLAGPYVEFTLVWGFIPLIIVALFFFGLRGPGDLHEREWRLVKVSGCAYVFLALAIYGDYSAVSDLLYLVPSIGRMHIYQRHLLAGQFFLMICVAVMLTAICRRTTYVATKSALFTLLVLLLISAQLLSTNNPLSGQLLVNDFVVFELALAVVFVASLLMPGRQFPFLAGTILMFLIPLDKVYNYSSSAANRHDAQKAKSLTAVDRESNQKVVSYFRSHSKKAIIKYVDLTQGVNAESFSRNYPWFNAITIPLSTYGGYDWHLSRRSDYGRRMTMEAPQGRWVMRPDWEYVANTGADFVLFEEGNPLNDAKLADVADLSEPANVLRMPNKLILAPFRPPARRAFQGGDVRGRYVRVQLSGAGFLSLAEVQVFRAGAQTASNLALGKPATQSSNISPDTGAASSAVDGNTQGDYGLGSVTHTRMDTNAWWDVDLGVVEDIGSVRLWNRTGGDGERLSDFWVFISDKPFNPSDTPEKLSGRRDVLRWHETTFPRPSHEIVGSTSEAKPLGPPVLFDNGYLKVSGHDGKATIGGFQTDGASRFTLDLNSTSPLLVQYLFWPNDRLSFKLDSNRIEAPVRDGLQTVTVPAGRHHLEIQYRYWPLTLFLVFYCLYTLSIMGSVAYPFLYPAFTRYSPGWFK